jgi:hypothetical protein
MCSDAARFMRACESMTPEAREVFGRAIDAAQEKALLRPSWWLVGVFLISGWFFPSPWTYPPEIVHAEPDISFMRPFAHPYSPIFRAGVLNNRICRGAHIKYKMSYAPRCGRPTPDGIIIPVEF